MTLSLYSTYGDIQGSTIVACIVAQEIGTALSTTQIGWIYVEVV